MTNPDFRHHAVIGTNELELYREINNENILANAGEYSTKFKFLPMEINRIYTNRIVNNEIPITKTEESRSTSTWFYGDYYYSRISYMSTNKWIRKRIQYGKQSKIYYNYKIVDHELVPIKFDDLFIDTNYHDIIDGMIVDVMNANHFFVPPTLIYRT
ncbi:MAG: hypothetical protein HRT57_16590 [Crocinitomicaceae bacterium]|nr:hypothetical protein [Crocinitomicaceae bacterium]